jgi:CheY-like chemotaxis protein
MADLAVTDAAPADAAWKILVVDDEPAIHQVTRLALRNLSVLGRPSQLINALSAKDAREQFSKHPDIAVVLLDVVMETEDAGLEFIKYLREQVSNPLVRIILRTGQPGQAPERQVMVDYDINDYKEKTELTAAKLYTSVMSSIRTFGHMQSMQNRERAIEVLGHLNSEVFAAADISCLASTMLAQLSALELFSAVACWTHGGPGAGTGAGAETPDYATGIIAPLQDQREMLLVAHDSPGELVARDTLYAAALSIGTSHSLAVAMTAPKALASAEIRLMELWLRSVSVALMHWSEKS